MTGNQTLENLCSIKYVDSQQALAHFIMLIHDFLNKDPDIVPEEAPLIVLDNKFSMCMAKNGKYTKHTRHIARRINFVSNGEK